MIDADLVFEKSLVQSRRSLSGLCQLMMCWISRWVRIVSQTGTKSVSMLTTFGPACFWGSRAVTSLEPRKEAISPKPVGGVTGDEGHCCGAKRFACIERKDAFLEKAEKQESNEGAKLRWQSKRLLGEFYRTDHQCPERPYDTHTEKYRS